jgi:hypothetical protein
MVQSFSWVLLLDVYQHISNVYYRCDEVSSSWPASIGHQLLATDSEDVWTAGSFVIRRVESRFS